MGDLGSNPGLQRSSGEGKGYWPREFHRLYSPWGRKESDMTEQLSFLLTDLFIASTVPGTQIGIKIFSNK